MMKVSARFLFFVLGLILLTTACKFFLAANFEFSGFSPVIAIAVFAGMIIQQRRYSFIMPLLALLVSDLIIHVLYLSGQFDFAGIYHGQWKIYLMLLSTTLIGRLFQAKSYLRIGAAALVAPTLFYLISNFAVWLGADGVLYTKDFSGLVQCYVAAIPFYKNALLATVGFLPVLLLSYNAVMNERADVRLLAERA